MGKNNLLLALKDLQKSKGLEFRLTYTRGPFFLMGSQANIDANRARRNLPKDAPEHMVRPKKHDGFSHLDAIMDDAGLSPRNLSVIDNRIMRDTMPAHRLAQYAAKYESNEAGEKMWFALSRRWFEGKDTQILPVMLDNPELLLECAEYAGLNMANVHKVLDGDLVHDEEVREQVRRVKAVAINWIPQIVFEVEGLAEGSWREDPALPETPYRIIHAGSGSKASFIAVLQQLHQNVIGDASEVSRRFYPGMNQSVAQYSGNPNDYAAAFEGGMRHFPSWPEEAKEVVATAIAEAEDMDTLTRVLVNDTFDAFGTKNFSEDEKEEISERLRCAHGFTGLLRQLVDYYFHGSVRAF